MMIKTKGASEFLSALDSKHIKNDSELRTEGSVIFVFKKAKNYRQVNIVLGLYHKNSGQGKVFSA